MKTKKTGFSLLEILVTMSIMFLVTPMLMKLIIDIQENSSSNIASAIQRSRDSAGLSRIGRTINSSSKFIARYYDDNKTPAIEIPPEANITGTPTSISQFYLRSIVLPTTFTNGGKTYTPLEIKSRVLPVYDPSGTFSPENVDTTQFLHPFTTSNVGNTLMCITVEDYLTYPYNTSGDYSAISPLKRRFPLYQIHYFFLAKTSGGEFEKRVSTVSAVNKQKLSLFEWKSQYLLDYNDLNNFVTCGTGTCAGCGFTGSCSITGRGSTVLTSFKTNVNSTVKADLSPSIRVSGIIKQSESDYAVNTPIAFPLSLATMASATKLNGAEYIDTAPIPMLSIENVIFYPNERSSVGYGIAANNYISDPTYKASSANRVPFFKGTQSLYPSALDGFPHGFEVMLSGTAGSTKAFIRLTTLASGYGTYAYNPNMITFQGKN